MLKLMCGAYKKPLHYVETKIMYNSILRFCIETYSTVCLCTCVGLMNIRGRDATEKVESLVSIAMIPYCLMIPTYMYRLLRNLRKNLHLPQTKALYYSIYMQVDYYNIKALSFTVF